MTDLGVDVHWLTIRPTPDGERLVVIAEHEDGFEITRAEAEHINKWITGWLERSR